jgi:hypothetical protein
MTDDLEDKGWRALEYLKTTDDKHAELQHEARRAEFAYKKTIDAGFLLEEGNVEERKASARVRAEEIYLGYMETQRKADEIKNRRDTAQLSIDYIRSIMANRRQG